ncbi:MAG: hypothetical protein OI74_03225 [Gammaproteobacteria bacterium (ex Lamellibrachia satsuma)]|nr:MAG: hypothetical protein HPY30_12320 [Gammaproteobacteria bacterium (ex Lamellibrachia satsuma)]RRS34443.1 MAG: hypothetical protein NV67_13185 [Gammaproteobacteria bacterium (ex Lamellibrachia satsuma)]RRS35105.1 MAG: hypothetical protein OI74_03225 [Gammaproteobacteria bacterium (ex Lamellibrachia satsuma)]
MIRLHCTKKLLAKLPLREGGRLRNRLPNHYASNDEGESLLSDWHANLILLQRRQCVLLVHDATRFPLFVPALKQDDFAELDWHFSDVFMNVLLKTGADEEIMDRAHEALGPLVCDTDCNRSVQGTMNQMAQDIEHRLWYENASVMDLAPYRTSVWLADRPCTVKGVKDCIWPVQAMKELLVADRVASNSGTTSQGT